MKNSLFGFFALFVPVAAVAQGALTLENAWVRALPPMQPTTAAYVTLYNSGDTVAVVQSASASIAGRVEIHTTREVDGMMRMEQLQQVAVNPGQQLAFAPGGIHLMLLDLERMPAPGDDVKLCLQLASGEDICTVAQTRKGGSAAHQHHHH